MSEKVKITVNGETHEVEKGRWLIDVLGDLGHDIPHFCYHPGLGPDGNCRMCQVEYVSERGSRIGISCNIPASEGLSVETDSEAAKAARAGTEEFLLLNHPLDCPICDKAGECTLQNYYMDHDLKDSRQDFVRFKQEKALDIGPTLVLDQERCVLCDRCVRFLRDWAGEEQLYIAGRGHSAYITTFPGKDVTSAYSLNTYDLCPVGALTSKDFRFSIPTWFLKRTPSVCTTCARGCAIELDTNAKKVYRLRPRHNPYVNEYWMCDEGRLNYRFVNDDRIEDSIVKSGEERVEASVENGIYEIAEVIGIGSDDSKTERLTILVSVTATVEEMFVLKKLARARGARLLAARHVPDGEEDHLLRRADRHPNAKGAELLGIETLDLRDGGEGVTGEVPEDGVLFAVGFDYAIGTALEDYARQFGKIAMVTSRKTDLADKAQVVVPGLTFAEKDGLIVNFEGHIQKLTPALDGLWDRLSTWQVISQLLTSLEGASGFDNIESLRDTLGKEEPAFAGVNLNAVGLLGVRLEAQTV